MDVSEFVSNERATLTQLLHSYLELRITHSDMQAYFDGALTRWEQNVLEKDATPATKSENELWCALWAIQHMASTDHWADGSAQRELRIMQNVLEGKQSLPVGYTGRRP